MGWVKGAVAIWVLAAICGRDSSFNMYSTVMRLPATTGFPSITLGSETILAFLMVPPTEIVPRS